MLISYSFLIFVFLIYVFYFFKYKKEYKYISFLYSFGLVTIFVTPAIYFFYGGEVYRFFSNESLIEFYYYSSIILILYIFLDIVTNTLRFKSIYLSLNGNLLINLYFSFFILIVGLYYILYFNKFPLVHFILSGELIDRPDLTGAIPHFYTMSTIVSFVIPSIYFFYFHNINSKILHLFINLIIFFLFVASGNKGFFVYYLIFIWIYIFKAKIDFKLILIFFFSLFVYMITKGITEINKDVIDYLLSSPFRRFFVTQGTGMIHRIDMVNEGFDFLSYANPRGLKFDVFAHMYNTTTVGSAPTFFTGDILAKYGILISLLSFVFISTLVLIISKIFHRMNTNKKLFFYWNIYAALFMIVMAEITTASFLRILTGFLNVLIILLLNKIKIIKKGANYE